MKEKVRERIRGGCALPEIKLGEDTLLNEISLDSLSFIEVLVSLEEEFHIEFEDEELNFYHWIKIGDIVKAVENKIVTKI